LRDLADREVRRTRAIGAAVGTAGEHRFHHLLRASELEGLDVEPGLLEISFFDGGEERQPGDGPVADRIFGTPARAGGGGG
jgi:hypothetical protein